MSEFGGFIVYHPVCPVQPMSVNCSTLRGMETCIAIKEALRIPFDFSKFEIICNCDDIVRFRIEGPIMQDDLERVLKACKQIKGDQNGGSVTTDD